MIDSEQDLLYLGIEEQKYLENVHTKNGIVLVDSILEDYSIVYNKVNGNLILHKGDILGVVEDERSRELICEGKIADKDCKINYCLLKGNGKSAIDDVKILDEIRDKKLKELKDKYSWCKYLDDAYYKVLEGQLWLDTYKCIDLASYGWLSNEYTVKKELSVENLVIYTVERDESEKDAKNVLEYLSGLKKKTKKYDIPGINGLVYVLEGLIQKYILDITNCKTYGKSFNIDKNRVGYRDKINYTINKDCKKEADISIRELYEIVEGGYKDTGISYQKEVGDDSESESMESVKEDKEDKDKIVNKGVEEGSKKGWLKV